MNFIVETAAGRDMDGNWGNTEKIKQIKGTTVKIKTLKDLEKLYYDVGTELIINFETKTIEIYDYYLS